MAKNISNAGRHVAFDDTGTSLRIISPEGAKNASRPALSPSTAHAFTATSCHAKWAAGQQIPRQESPWMVSTQGTAVHAILENALQMPKGQRNAKLLFEQTVEQFFPAESADPAERAKFAKELRSRMAGYTRCEKPNDVDPVYFELPVSQVEVNGVPFNGVIDRVDFDEETQHYRIRDYKTGSVPTKFALSRFGDSHSDQLRLYALAFAAKYPEAVVDDARLLYTAAGVTRTVSLSDADLDDAASGFVDSWGRFQADVQSGSFQVKPGGLCGYCPFVQACRAGSEWMSERDRLPSVPTFTPDELGMPDPFDDTPAPPEPDPVTAQMVDESDAPDDYWDEPL